MPQDMQLEIQKITGSGDGVPHLNMTDWADRAQSKAVLGQTTSSEARATGLGSGVADLHGEVRRDIRNADARQIAGTLTRDLIYPLIAINRGGIEGLRRCPRFVFDTGEPEDLVAFSEALPKLSGVMRIPAEWAHEKLRIPLPKDGEPILGAAAPPFEKGGPGGISPPAALAALTAEDPDPSEVPDQAALDAAIEATVADLAGAGHDFMAPVVEALMGSADYAEAFERLAELWPQLDTAEIERRLGNALVAAEAWGRLSAK